MTSVPFTMRRTVKWGETDPAGIVYTARFLDYTVEAVEAWFTEIVGIDWYRLKAEMGLGSPMAHASLDFRKPLFPAEEFTVEVWVMEVGRAATTFKILGRNLAREICFEGKLVSVIIDAERIKARTMPDDFRARIEAYRQACAALETTPPA